MHELWSHLTTPKFKIAMCVSPTAIKSREMQALGNKTTFVWKLYLSDFQIQMDQRKFFEFIF